MYFFFFFFFQAEDGIRDLYVTGVQTCALPILIRDIFVSPETPQDEADLVVDLFAGIKSGRLPQPEYPSEQAEEWRMRFLALGGTPFTMQDTPAGLFPDLDA